MELTGRQKRHLRSLAHHLRALVSIGKSGITEEVLDQIDANLLAHELIKVKLLQSCPADRDECAGLVAGKTGAVLAQSIGRTLLFYRPHPEKPVIDLPG